MKQSSYQVYGLQKTFAKDIDGILTSDLIMIYPASTSSIEVTMMDTILKTKILIILVRL
jgi:molybdopterin biosynthesis enzyme MoaB